MRIEGGTGDTIVFKSAYAPFTLEYNGKKPNTVRIVPPTEISDFVKWSRCPDCKIRIEIEPIGATEQFPVGSSFIRDVTNVYELGQVLGNALFVISWRHR